MEPVDGYPVAVFASLVAGDLGDPSGALEVVDHAGGAMLADFVAERRGHGLHEPDGQRSQVAFSGEQHDCVFCDLDVAAFVC